jgi:Alternative complex III, ActD subunit
MQREPGVLGLFSNEDQAVAVIRELEGKPWKLQRVHSPIPSHRIAAALKLKKSKVGYFTLMGGIFGFLSGFALAIFTATKWSLIIGGKPVVAWVPFVIVGFEFTILFSVFGNVIGILALTGLPRAKISEIYDPRCSGDHFGILATYEAGQADGLKDLFERNGGEVKVFS